MSPNISTALSTIGNMIGIGAAGFADNQIFFILNSYLFLFIFAMILSTKTYDVVQAFVYNHYKMKAVYATWAIYLLMLVICVAFIVGGTYHSFLYFAF